MSHLEGRTHLQTWYCCFRRLYELMIVEEMIDGKKMKFEAEGGNMERTRMMFFSLHPAFDLYFDLRIAQSPPRCDTPQLRGSSDLSALT